MLNILPNELIGHIYAWLPLKTVTRRTIQVSRMHRSFSIQRIIKAVHSLQLTLTSDLLESIYAEMDLQLPVKCTLAKSATSSDEDTMSFSCSLTRMLMFVSRVTITRIKLVVKEDWSAGCSASLQTADYELSPLSSQMGILVSDEEVSAYRLLDAVFAPSRDIVGASVPLADYPQLETRKHAHFAQRVVTGFKNSVHLLSASYDELVDNDTGRRERYPRGNSLGLEWDLFVFSEKSRELGAYLQKASIPISAVIDGFQKYCPGLNDLDTDDGLDSEWMSESDDTVEGFYEDEVDDDDIE